MSVSEEGWAATVPTFLFVLRASRIRFDKKVEKRLRDSVRGNCDCLTLTWQMTVQQHEYIFVPSESSARVLEIDYAPHLIHS